MKVAVIAWVMFAVLVIIGWVKNIIALVDFGFDAGVTIEIGLRIAGVFVVPLGSIMGWFV